MSQVAAMKQALEALGKIEEHGNVPGWCEFDTNEDAVNYHEAFNKGMKASTALRAAIAEQEKCEPVATVKIAETIKQLVELVQLMKFHFDTIADEENWDTDGTWNSSSYPDEIANEAIEAFNNFERNL